LFHHLKNTQQQQQQAIPVLSNENRTAILSRMHARTACCPSGGTMSNPLIQCWRGQGPQHRGMLSGILGKRAERV